MKSKKSRKIGIEGRALVSDHYSGVGHYLSGLVGGLEAEQTISEAGDNFSLIVPFRARKKAPHFKVRGFGYQYIPIPSRLYGLLSKWNLLPPLDLFLGRKTYFFPNYFSWPLLRSNSIVVVYDLVFMTYPEFVVPANLEYLKAIVPKFVKSADTIVTISKSSKAEIHKHLGIPKNRIKIVYPAADRSLFYKRSNAEVKAVKTKYGIHGKYLLFIGNIEPRKNLLRTLQAFDKLPSEHKESLSFVVVGGDSWLSDDVHDKIFELRKKGLKIVQPESFVPDKDLPALYTGAEIFLFPSLYEGFGMPVIEAMSCGTPVLCSDNSSIPEAAGNAAKYVKATSVSSIKTGIEELLEDDKQRGELSKKGTDQAKEFSWRASAKKLLEVIDETENRTVKS